MEKDSRILIACEESGAVTDAFMDLGFTNVWSCDLLPCSGKNPDHHSQTDVTELLKEEWALIIAFPPCTHLCVSGAAWFKEKIADGRQQDGVSFFMMFANHPCKRVAIENPVGVMSNKWRKPDQIIQPWMFGHMESKKTCLWLKGLPLLNGTNNVYAEMMKLPRSEREKIYWLGSNHSKERSKTFPGIAKAMAAQWSVDYADPQISLF